MSEVLTEELRFGRHSEGIGTEGTNVRRLIWINDGFPASLFVGGQAGAWYDPSDLATLYQDRAGTSLVTTTGQFVGKMLDKSGNGNHLTAPSDAARPIYTLSGVLSYLLFDGSDDQLFSAGNLIPITGDASFASAYTRLAGGTAGKYLFNTNTGGNGALSVLHAANAPRWFSTRVGGNSDITSGTSTTDGQKAVLRAKADRTNLLHTLYLNAVSVGTAATTNTDFIDPTFGIGGGVSGFATMQFYGGVFLARIFTTDEAALLDTYLGVKAGIVL